MKTQKSTALFFTCMLGILPVASIAQPYTLSVDGSEVTDQKTGLIWKRCSEGMSWNGTTCAGTAGTFTHEAALTQASSQATSTGVSWRVPNVKELASIVDKSQVFPSIDTTAFPAIPLNNFWWSSTPAAGQFSYVWSVDFYTGINTPFTRDGTFYVRLVRTGQ